MRRINSVADSIKNIFWLIHFGFKNLKIRFFSLFSKDYSDPYRLLIKTNNSCNYKCATCGLWRSGQSTFLSEEAQKNIINKYKNQLFFLSITGGEPFLNHEKMIEFVKKLKLTNPKLRYISINTNCSFPTRVKGLVTELLDSFPRLVIYIGLHYIPDKEWGVKKTGVKNAYDNYKKTNEVAKKLKSKYKNRFSSYKILTISRRKDVEAIKRENNLWINFATWDEFYDNQNNDYIEKLTRADKLEIINKFLDFNKNNIGFLNKKYIYSLKKILKGERKRKCFAGITRTYVDQNASEFICSRKLKERNSMSEISCKNCWTSCEANFDLVPYFFLRPLINLHEKDLQSN